MENTISITHFKTPIGEMITGIYHDTCVLLDFQHRRSLQKLMESKAKLLQARYVEEFHPLSDQIITQVNEYLSGIREDFDFPLQLVGTDFQKKVWSALQEIDYGQTLSYGELAERTGSSARAVGNANGQNTLALAIPCHRVIGADGSLVGYGGGLKTKERLLRIENKNSGQQDLQEWY
jgi:methylated-DNA-[protein]-cysteine S-methyltransferase